ncbi:MAG TPA: hypothetical protein VFJ19_14440 [Nocardioidaceae bacterium]|nr:hypothetical protein [Nocardioidaceae bacterium]
MITAAVLCPHPPLLLRELTGRADPGADLRVACVAAVAEACEGAERAVVIGGDDTTAQWDESSRLRAARFGGSPGHASPPPADADSAPDLPLSLGIGRRLLDDAGWSGPSMFLGVSWEASDAEVQELAERIVAIEGRVLLLILGDGSARRGEKAPGYLDERAFDFDDSLAKALDTGDAASLAGLDVALASELMVFGAAGLRVMGAVALRQGEPSRASLTYNDDPFGVSYFIAVWRF